MNYFFRRCRIITCGICLSAGLVVNCGYGDLRSEEEISKVVSSLDWKSADSSSLPKSNSTLTPPEEYLYVIGNDAKEFSVISGNESRECLEAVAITRDLGSVYFEYIDSGFVPIDDWEELDPVTLLSDIKENTDEANKWRRANGHSEIHVMGWAQEPALDSTTNTVFWAIVAEDDGEIIVNSRALRLGRYGYEAITWVTDKDRYTPFGGCLDDMMRAHSFNKGARYQDHISGDKVAGYGVAALVAGVAGAKLVKFGGLAVVLKKFGVLLFAGIGSLFLMLKKRVKWWLRGLAPGR